MGYGGVKYWRIFKVWYQARQQQRAQQWRPVSTPTVDMALRSGKAGEALLERCCARLTARRAFDLPKL